MQVGRQAQGGTQREGLAQAQVVLVPQVFETAAVPGQVQSLDDVVGRAKPGHVRAFAVRCNARPVAIAVGALQVAVAALVAQAGRLDPAGIEHELIDAEVLYRHPSIALREQAAAATGDQRIFQQLVTDLEQAVEGTKFQRRTGSGKLVLRSALAVQRHQAGTATAATAVQLQGAETVHIQADTDRGVGVAGAK
ncbi:hypothetical protein D9M71_471380 [compost metagenome]